MNRRAGGPGPVAGEEQGESCLGQGEFGHSLQDLGV